MEIFDLKSLKLIRAYSFYSRNRNILIDKKEAERTMYMEGLLDMDKVRKATRIDTASGYRYCHKKFMSFCARYFGVTVDDMRKEHSRSLNN